MKLLFDLVPICPALFLFLSGFSITFYFLKSGKQILDKDRFIVLLKKGVLLILSAQLLFFIEQGFQLPDLLIAPGILNTIGWMTIISAIILLFKYKISLTVSVLIITTSLTVIFYNVKFFFVPFNCGYEPISPTIIFGFAGLLIGLCYNYFIISKNNIYIFLISILSLGILTVCYYSNKFGIFAVFFDNIGRYTITRIFNSSMLPQNIFFNSHVTGFYQESVWNYNINCFLATLGAVFCLFTISHFMESFFNKYLPKNIFILGRYAFFNYFYHLAVIAVVVLIFGYSSLDKISFLFFLIFLFALSVILSYFVNAMKTKSA